MSIIFTRYLYNKEDVKAALFTSIVNKQQQKSLFWAYEIYYSGFETELFAFLWKIYFDCFYTTNPSFYKYFTKKQIEWNLERTDTIVAAIIQNLLMRTYTLDVFLLRHIVNKFDIDIDTDIDTNIDTIGNEVGRSPLLSWLQEKNYIYIAEYILNRCQKMEETIVIIILFFKEHGISVDKLPIKTQFTYTDRTLALANIMLLFSMQEKRIIHKKLYVTVKDVNIARYATIQSSKDLRNDALLKKVYEHGIDDDHYLSLFSTRGDSKILRDNYLFHWEYYASLSPIWATRIQYYNGSVNHSTKKIEFDNEEEEEEFYNSFNYEPDEHSLETQYKSIQPIMRNRTWTSFYHQHKHEGLFIPDVEYLEEFETVKYE